MRKKKRNISVNKHVIMSVILIADHHHIIRPIQTVRLELVLTGVWDSQPVDKAEG